MTLLLLMASGAFVGLIHSLAPGHWLPVVLLTKARRWSHSSAIRGALTAASGHVLVSLTLGVVALVIGAKLSEGHEAFIERFAGLGIATFGVGYAVMNWKRHSHCHGHEHHGPDPRGEKRPYRFLFLMGLSPCVAALPVFAAAAPMGVVAVAMTMLAFAAGVVAALLGATMLVTFSAVKLDHPIFEHHGDVLTGATVALMGLLVFLLPEAFHFGGHVGFH
jgi:nickel/cobalt exporter